MSLKTPSTFDALRARYRPSRVSVLFIGEAPPAGGTFFYAGNSQVHRYLREALSSHLGDPPDFLSAFAARGYFLDDLVLEPVDRIPLNRRGPVLKQAVPLLATRLTQHRPQVIITILVRIAPYVEEAVKLVGLEVPHHRVPFPGNGQQGNFRRRMAEIVPSLP